MSFSHQFLAGSLDGADCIEVVDEGNFFFETTSVFLCGAAIGSVDPVCLTECLMGAALVFGKMTRPAQLSSRPSCLTLF